MSAILNVFRSLGGCYRKPWSPYMRFWAWFLLGIFCFTVVSLMNDASDIGKATGTDENGEKVKQSLDRLRGFRILSLGGGLGFGLWNMSRGIDKAAEKRRQELNAAGLDDRVRQQLMVEVDSTKAMSWYWWYLAVFFLLVTVVGGAMSFDKLTWTRNGVDMNDRATKGILFFLVGFSGFAGFFFFLRDNGNQVTELMDNTMGINRTYRTGAIQHVQRALPVANRYDVVPGHVRNQPNYPGPIPAQNPNYEGEQSYTDFEPEVTPGIPRKQSVPAPSAPTLPEGSRPHTNGSTGTPNGPGF